MIKHTLNSAKKREIIDITDTIQEIIETEHTKEGKATIFVAHTTAAITTADLDPGTDEDFLVFLDKITPNIRYQHEHNPQHAPDHILASIIGPSVTVLFMNKKLLLGTWQRITLVELDGPRERNIYIHVDHS